jgi:hypothetical protein
VCGLGKGRHGQRAEECLTHAKHLHLHAERAQTRVCGVEALGVADDATRSMLVRDRHMYTSSSLDKCT